MSRLTARPGLSFTPAPAPSTDPLRTDVAVFVGLLVRRAGMGDAAGPVPLPPVLAAWLQGQHLAAGLQAPLAAGVRMRWQGAMVRLDGVSALAQSLASACAPADAEVLRTWFGALAPAVRAALRRLLAECRRTAPLPQSVIDDLRARDLTPRTLGDVAELDHWVRVQRLHNLPVRVDRFDAFEALFDTATRPVIDRTPATLRQGDPTVAPPTATAVRAFFGEGGQCALIVRTGDPVALFASPGRRRTAAFPTTVQADRCALFPGSDAAPGTASVALDCRDWQGLEQVYGLPEASFVLLPDLIDALAPMPSVVAPPEITATAQQFSDCAEAVAGPEVGAGRRLPPPRLDLGGLQQWRRLVDRALAVLDNGGRPFHRRDVQLLVSLPLVLPGNGLPAPDDWLDWMGTRGRWLDETHDTPLLDERLQLAWPWVVTGERAVDPGGVEPPEGTLAGVLARNALQRGSFRSAARQPLWRLIDTEPRLGWTRAFEREVATPLGLLTLADRVCLLAPAASGPRLSSDVTCSASSVFRQASVRRLVNVVIQAARRLGEAHAFEPHGDALWARLRSQVGDLLRQLETAGALTRDGGASVVRCGRDTMTQADLDAGRLIVEIGLRPAQSVQRLVVVLDLRNGSASASALPALAA